MPYRLQDRSASAYSLTGSLQRIARTAFMYTGLNVLDEDTWSPNDSHALLGRMLSNHSHNSATSAVMDNSEAVEHEDLRRAVNVGSGQCGTIYAFTGTDRVIKIPNHGKDEVLFNDAQLHVRVLEAVQESPSEFCKDISVPDWHGWVQPSTTQWWNSHFPLFKSALDAPSYGLVTQRIFPLPQTIREQIIRAFCPQSLKRSALVNPQNKDCLVRLYLGRRDPQKREAESHFRMRNFPLLVNDMEQLGLDTERFARIMADALAILHWRAHIDGDDVEFVLGSAPALRMRPSSDAISNTTKDGRDVFDTSEDTVRVWLLDFNMCTRFTEEHTDGEDTSVVNLLSKAFWFNDPYYPRPVSTDEGDVRLWKVFSGRYLSTSGRFTDSATPGRFIATVEAEGLVRRERIAKQGKGSLFCALAG